MELTGELIVKGETKTFGSNGFQKREFVLKTDDDQYPQTIQIELTQDNCAKLDQFNIGQIIKASINLRGREWVNPQGETKYFNSIQAWRLEEKTNSSPVSNSGIPESEPDDLPFF